MKIAGRLRIRPRGAAGKLVVVGGTLAPNLLPHVGIPLAIAQAIRGGVAVIAGDPPFS
jgi:hypothetical protein